jgi:hypothetical protein
MLDSVTINKVRTAAHYKRVQEYARIAKNLKYMRFTKVLESTTLEEHFIHLLEAQLIQDFGQDGGGVNWSDMVLAENIYFNHFHKWGIKMSEAKFMDLQGSGIIPGINLMSEAVKQSTQLAAYLPQKLTVGTLRQGENTKLVVDGISGDGEAEAYPIKCYDGLSLFNTAHPLNFKKVDLGTFSNILSGAPSGVNPGFLPLGGPFKKNSSTGEWEYDKTGASEVSVEDAWNNLWLAVAYISTIRMPDGKTPRFLEPSTIINSKMLAKNVGLLLDAKTIAVHAGSGSSGGGSMDIAGAIKRLGFNEPCILHELGAAPDLATNSQDDTSIEQWDWYLECEEDNQAAEIGAINIGLRMPWNVKIYSDSAGSEGAQLELAVEDAVAAVGKMRLFVGVGQPQFIYKFKAPRS